MATDIALDQFQRWMKAVIFYSGTDEDALECREAASEIPADEAMRFVLPSKTLTQVERMGIYRDMYMLRLIEVMEGDFTTLRRFMEYDAFAELVDGYCRKYPSRSPSLGFLADHFPQYIKKADGMPRGFARHRDFIYDMARLELAVDKVFDAPSSPVLTKEAIAAVPPDAWENARLKTVDAFRVLAFRYPVNEYFQAVREEKPTPKPQRKETWLAVYRREYTIWRLNLTRPEHDLLASIASGTALGEAVDSIVSRYAGRESVWTEKMFKWFSDWVSEGIFQSIEY